MNQYNEDELEQMKRTAAGRDFLSRRKEIRIDPDFVLRLVSRGLVHEVENRTMLRFPEPLGLPGDAIVRHVYIDFASMDYRCVVISRGFEVVPEGSVAPVVNPLGWKWREYELRRHVPGASRADAYELIRQAFAEGKIFFRDDGDAGSVEQLKAAAEVLFK